MHSAAITTITLLASASLAHAQLFYVSQERRVSAGTDGPSESFSSDGLGLFDAEATSEFPPGSAFATASQTSTLGLGSITATGQTFADALNAFPASSFTGLDVTFDLNDPGDFAFDGSLFFADIGDARVILFGPGEDEEIFRLGFIPGSDFDFVQSLNIDGQLEAGRYRLLAQGFGQSNGEFDLAGGFDFTFSVTPAPGAGALFACSIFMVRRRRA